MPNDPKSSREPVDRKLATRLTPRLAANFCAVPTYFLQNYSRLKPNQKAAGLSSTEVMVLIHLLDFKWDARAPYPTLATIAKRMGVSTRTVRGALKTLEDLGYIQREQMRHGGPNRYHLEGLFAALERMMEDDAVSEAQAASIEVSAPPPRAASPAYTGPTRGFERHPARPVGTDQQPTHPPTSAEFDQMLGQMLGEAASQEAA